MPDRQLPPLSHRHVHGFLSESAKVPLPCFCISSRLSYVGPPVFWHPLHPFIPGCGV
jgi:hypothetical protein